ncbi:MAG: hypothetical protein P8R54_04555 [Myxococcota bacterium]|nr:hypothetical protein [Myxococcota bacterium]
MRALFFLPLLACASDAQDDPQDTCDQTGEREVLLLTTIAFPRETDGVTNGFNLDDDVSVEGGSTGCGVADQLSEDGEEGIDNSFAKLRPALDATEASALDAIVQEAINGGGLLVMVQLDGVDSLENDDCVDVSITGGLGDPLRGPNGQILSGQTFERDPEAAVSQLKGAAIVDGVLQGGPIALALPFQFLDADVIFSLQGGLIRLELDPDGAHTGMVGGGTPTEEISALAHNTGIDETVEAVLDTLLSYNADLAPDETDACAEISVTLEFEAASAFFLE